MHQEIAAQEAQAPEKAQARPRWQLVRELKKAAAGTSTDFNLWWEKLSKDERKALVA